ncbi:FAD-binding domain-containing protein [Neobacillus terrae]|uniref:FAD-binding domain-containing protein n=1 Tax=Neobacillus terrae TaxID=3034837 RepID=UPI00140A8A36|nr:FAD-binding domain-containing protein [Neobacillus terrae]NHM29470.1 hypothetical protein [Neobacillus terrae]
MNIVWYSRDLRISDHKPLYEASKQGDVLPLYVVEPSRWKQEDFSARHFQFILESLGDLEKSLNNVGGSLIITEGEMEEVLEKFKKDYGFFGLYFNTETGTPFLEERNKRIRDWMAANQMPIYEFTDFPIEKEILTKTKYRKWWEAFISEAPLETPKNIRFVKDYNDPFFMGLKHLEMIKIKGSKIRYDQLGGESGAFDSLTSFLDERHERYLENYKKPIQSSFSSSRISPYLTWGNISLRTAAQKTEEHIKSLNDENSKVQLNAFLDNLFIRSYTMDILSKKNSKINATTDLNFDQIRAKDDHKLELLFKGKTGIPIIDSLMRNLEKTGWLPFYSRVLVASFAVNTLLLDWYSFSIRFANLLLDYEPAIHFYQMKLLSGILDKKSIKILDPIKVGKEIDRDGSFIKRNVQELKNLPAEYIHEPWRFPGFYQLGYPSPIIDVAKENKRIKEILKSYKKDETINAKKSGRANKKGDNFVSEQLSLDL